MKPPNFKLQTSNFDNSNLKVAIVHDWLYGGGAELVVEQLHKLYPDAPIYTSYCSDEWRERLDNKVVTGFLQHQPFAKLRKYVGILRIWWFRSLDLSDYDLIISSTGNGEAFGIRKPKNATHICYCHTPTHYYWRHYDTYLQRPGFGIFDWLARIGLKVLVGPLRRWDYRAAQKPDVFIANSTHIQKDIKKYYGRDSIVIHPPVYLERFQKPENKNLPRKGFVISGRQTPYKRFDLAVQACTNLNLPLTVIGDGPDNARLRSLAGPNVTFLGRAPDEIVEKQFASAEAFIFPGFDDFGISPVESLAAGTPVIAYKAGGALDFVVPGKTGEFFAEQTVESLEAALKRFDPKAYKPKDITAKAQEFTPKHFQAAMNECVKKHAR